MSTIEQIFATDGPFSRQLSHYRQRPSQTAMAQHVSHAIAHSQTLISEAGTGTGKTFAYLVPALLSGKKVIISTGTKNLQDQLFCKDLAIVRKSLGIPAKVVLLKGRANYLCQYRLEFAGQDGLAHQPKLVDALQRIYAWSGRTRSGDVAEVAGIAEDSPVWPLVTSTPDNCISQDCPHYSDCYVLNARKAAQSADIVVVNHHLLFADMVLKEGGFGELLPAVDVFILDEAHQVPEVAANFFGTTLSSRQLLELSRDTVAEHLREAGDMQGLPECAGVVEKATLELRIALGKQPQRRAWREVLHKPLVGQRLAQLREALQTLCAWLEQAAARGKGLERCWQRSVELLERLALLSELKEQEYIHWFETFTRSFQLSLTPLDIAKPFQAAMQRFAGAWIFTSATLSVNAKFDHFCERLGLAPDATQCLDSPFDYARHALLYLPDEMPVPSDANFTQQMLVAAIPVLEITKGRAFVLFTSHSALQQVAKELSNRIPYPVLVQGSAPKAELLERFRALGNAVLLGTSSFWEGVDVRGAALSCVIIDKLPFAAPSDPVLQARLDALRRQGSNPFFDYQIPQAVIALRQGAGRLIRDDQDRGLLMICDPRLLGKPYGKIFLRSLPMQQWTNELQTVRQFFDAQEQQPTPKDPWSATGTS